MLVYHGDQPFVFARIEQIEPDMKKDWYHVTLLLLTIPLQTVTWILTDRYIDGEVFTMGGQPMRLEEVKRVAIRKEGESRDQKKDAHSRQARVIPFKRP